MRNTLEPIECGHSVVEGIENVGPAIRKPAHFIFAACLLLITCPATSDTIHLHNGKNVHGTIEAGSPGKIMVRTNDGLVSLSRNQVRAISKDEPAAARFKMAKEAFERGDLESGFDNLPSDSGTSASTDAVAALLMLYEERILDQANRLSPNILVKLDALAGRHPSMDRLITIVYAARKDWGRALDQYRRMKLGGFLDNQDNRRKLASGLVPFIESGRRGDALDEQMLELADAVYPDAGGTSTTIVLREVSVASHLAQSGRLTSAVLVLADRVSPAAPELAVQRSLALLKQAQEQDSTATVAEICEVIEARFGESMPGAVAPVFEQHAILLCDAGRFDAADATAERLSALLPDEGAILKHRVEFARRRAQPASREPKAAYELALWARDMGLILESKRALQSLLRAPEIQENAELQLKLIALQEGKAKLEKLKRLVEQGRSAEVFSEAAKYRREHPDSPLLKKVGELEELARYSKWNRDRGDAARADAVYQNGERMFLQGRFQEALKAVESCLLDYPSTPAADKAGKLRARIEKEISRRSIR